MIGLIWAQSTNGVIGRNGDLPWHVPEDLAYFKSRTTGSTVVMGRKTWFSLDTRPLPGRHNVVVTRDRGFIAPGATVVHDLDQALSTAPDLWVIGGAEIYAAAMTRADRLDVTEIDVQVDGDAFAPVIDESWRVAERIPEAGWTTSRSGSRYRVKRYERVTVRRGTRGLALAFV